MVKLKNPTGKKSLSTFILAAIAFAVTARAANFFVAVAGSDSNPGTPEMPFRTIQHAADAAQPGDLITVSAGIYRECVNPPRGGLSETQRIVYQGAPGEHVVITGSEIVTNWTRVCEHVWTTTLPNSFFGGFNPYTNVIHGDWFSPLGRVHHTGAVYLNGDWLTEAATLDPVLKPITKQALWFARVDGQNTTIWAQFKTANPNQRQVEINARQTVFYPRKSGINYITVQGFTLEDAATPWSPPTAEQIGLIGTHWSKGWIIEGNVIRYSMCAGVTLGKYGDQWDNRAGSADGYVGTIHRALTNGWNKATIGHHIVRYNDISHCEQGGVVGSMGGAFSTISDNNIHDIHVMNWFSGAEMAGIKLHAAVDVTISHNHIYRCCLGTWLDWMAQGTCLTGNLYHDNRSDTFFEVDHGPFLVDNNIFLSSNSLSLNSQGGAFVHNFVAGAFRLYTFDGRETPFFKAHSTELMRLHNNPSGDLRFYNNIFVQRPDLGRLDHAKLPSWTDGNVYLNGAKPSQSEKNPLVKNNLLVELGFVPPFKLVQKHDHYYLCMKFNKAWTTDRRRELVTSELLGKATISDLPYEQANGEPISISTDYFGNNRNDLNPTPGPFECPPRGKLKLMVW